MADFRKWFPVLAILTLLMGSVASAQVSSPFQCTSNTGAVPPTVRASGLTELVGDILLTCQGGVGMSTFLANVTVFLNTNVTSRLLTSGTTAGFNGAGALLANTTESLLFTGANGIEPYNPASTVAAPQPMTVYNGSNATGTSAANTFRGLLNGSNSVTWLGVPITPPSTPGGTFTIRITNVRADASQVLQGGGLFGQVAPNPIVAYISISGAQSVPIGTNPVTVAIPQTAMTGSLTDCTGTASASLPVKGLQCLASPAGYQFGLTFRENFGTAWKVKGPVAGQDPSTPGVSYGAVESGFVNTASLGTETGFATNGTRILARFQNVPSGVTLYVSNTSINVTSASTTGYGALVATDAAGAGSGITLGTSTFTNCAGFAGTALPVTPDGTAYAAWEYFLGASGSPTTAAVSLEQLTFGVTLSWAANGPALSDPAKPLTVQWTLAPAYAASTPPYNQAATGAALPIPRFVAQWQPVPPTTLVAISACVTNLLFPYVTNFPGYETGIAIANTAQDPWGTVGQTGTCTLNYYQNQQVTTQTTNPVAPGQTVAFTMTNGGGGTTSIPAGFVGYMIATCRFQYAHGFSFISDPNGARANFAMGYLALIMDKGTPTPSRGTGGTTPSPSVTGSEALDQ